MAKTIFKSANFIEDWRGLPEAIVSTECEHKHRTPETAEKCAYKRNPTMGVGSLIIQVFARDDGGRGRIRLVTKSERHASNKRTGEFCGLGCADCRQEDHAAGYHYNCNSDCPDWVEMDRREQERRVDPWDLEDAKPVSQPI